MAVCLSFFACVEGGSGNPLKDKQRPVAETAALSAKQTVEKFVLPDGFAAKVFASEPDIVQPIGFTMDARGRVWVLENTNYPICPGQRKDRIVILEDSDGDGMADKKSVFYDKLSFASGIAIGYGGVWVGAPPNLLYFPRKEDEDSFLGEPKIVLDGWGGQDTHETLNNFRWGPDGWLYGTHGIFTHSKVGRPGADDSQRVKLNAAIWRYHPKKKIFERYAEGASNQWGLDFNDRGQAFFAACVIPHMWEGIQGAHYTRQAGSHFNPYTYENISTIADFSYEKRAYCGAMVYLGGQWPSRYRDTFFFGDIHMNRLRNEKFVRAGSGHRAEKNGDFLHSKDAWYRGLSPQYGPDGSVFICDWYDRIPCHQQRKFTDRSNGRIYRIKYGNRDPVFVNLEAASSEELVANQLHQNDWMVRQSRRILAERGPDGAVHSRLRKILEENSDETRKLRVLWALHVTDGLSDDLMFKLLSQKSEYIRAWVIQLSCEDKNPSVRLLKQFLRMAAEDRSALVRRYLASAAARLDEDTRKKLLIALASRREDLADQNIPQLIWYAAEPVVARSPSFAIELLEESEIPLLSRCIARRLSEGGNVDSVVRLVTAMHEYPSSKAADVMEGMNGSLKGDHRIDPPDGWAKLYTRYSRSNDKRLVDEAKKLGANFGEEAVIAELRSKIESARSNDEQKREALERFVDLNYPGVSDLLIELLEEPGPLREMALKKLAKFPTGWQPQTLVDRYQGFSEKEKQACIQTLVSNRKATEALLDAVDSKKIPLENLSAQVVRQVQGLNVEEMNRWLSRHWGSVKKSSKKKQSEMAEYRKFLGEEAILNANASNGRLIFDQRCSACHKMHGSGSEIGPELPGNFKDVDYLLLNLLDPNATIGKDYQQTFVTKKNGQVLSGVIVKKNTKEVMLKTLLGTEFVAMKEVHRITTSELSLMPEGLLNGLEEPEIRDLFLYLRQASQVPLPSE
ncbi:MAG: PVC-type heme-binding CxxCH protein [Akkermansiaceae bacterium]